MSERQFQDMTAQEKAQTGAEVLEWPSPGARLRKLRQEQQLSQTEVAERLHLTVHYINALEQDLYEKLPGRVFVKGYIRSYCTLLGVDPEELVGWYERFTAAHEASREAEIKAAHRQQQRRDQSRIWLAGAACLLLVIAGLSWWFAGREDSTPGVVPPTVNNGATSDVERSDPLAVERAALAGGESADTGTEVAEAAIRRPEPEASQLAAEGDSTLAMNSEQTDTGRVISLQGEGEDRVDISSHGRSWIEIDNGAGERVFNDLLQSGDELHIRSVAPFNILFGDASQVVVDFNEEPVDLRNLIRSDNSARITLER